MHGQLTLRPQQEALPRPTTAPTADVRHVISDVSIPNAELLLEGDKMDIRECVTSEPAVEVELNQ
jgi:hypothetical protein